MERLLEGPIVIGSNNRAGTGRQNYEANQERIGDGEVVEQRLRGGARRPEHSRRRMQGGPGDTSDELSSVPSYDRGPGLGSGRPAAAQARRLAEGAGRLGTEPDELMSLGGTSDLAGLRELAIEEPGRGASRIGMGGNQEGTDRDGRD